MIGISEKQGEMLAFIESFVSQHGFPPTREEIRTGLNISTKSLVNYHLEALENAALIARIPNTPRGLKLISENEVLNAASSMQQNKGHSTGDLPGLNQDEVIELTYGMVTNNSNLYALKMQNDTANDEAKEGDIVILQRQSRVQNGDMAVVRFNCGQLAIKQYFRENGHVRLQSAGVKKQAEIVTPDAIQVEGKVVAIIREVE